MKYWFVNIGQNYETQRNGKYIWTSIDDKRTTYDHENLKYVNKGDIIFCNKHGITDIAIALKGAYSADRPKEFQKDDKKKHGIKIDLKMINLPNPLKYKDYILEKNIKGKESPFNKKGEAKEGFIYQLDSSIAKYFLDEIKKINKDKIKEINELLSIDNNEYDENELLEEQEQFERINKGIIKRYSEEELKQKEKELPQKKIGNKREYYKTDIRLKETRIEMANYTCELDKNHKTFTNASKNHQYLECHHIIPMKAQGDYSIKLDNMFNLIALCPNCHRKVHYAIENEQKEVFMKMYEIRKDEMLEHGFDENQILEILKKYY